MHTALLGVGVGGWREEATAAGRECSSAKLLSGPQCYFRVKSVKASYRQIEVKIYFVTVCLLFFFLLYKI